MRKKFVLFMGLVACVSLLGGGSAAAGPAVGEQAPAFELEGSDGKHYALSQFVGERGVVLAWFPRAFTSG
jgi:peroxiredoxin Q/BCP